MFASLVTAIFTAGRNLSASSSIFDCYLHWLVFFAVLRDMCILFAQTARFSRHFHTDGHLCLFSTVERLENPSVVFWQQNSSFCLFSFYFSANLQLTTRLKLPFRRAKLKFTPKTPSCLLPAYPLHPNNPSPPLQALKIDWQPTLFPRFFLPGLPSEKEKWKDIKIPSASAPKFLVQFTAKGILPAYFPSAN